MAFVVRSDSKPSYKANLYRSRQQFSTDLAIFDSKIETIRGKFQGAAAVLWLCSPGANFSTPKQQCCMVFATFNLNIGRIPSF